MIQFLSWMAVIWLGSISTISVLMVVESLFGPKRSFRFAFWSGLISSATFVVLWKMFSLMFDKGLAQGTFGVVAFASLSCGVFIARQEIKEKRNKKNKGRKYEF